MSRRIWFVAGLVTGIALTAVIAGLVFSRKASQTVMTPVEPVTLVEPVEKYFFPVHNKYEWVYECSGGSEIIHTTTELTPVYDGVVLKTSVSRERGTYGGWGDLHVSEGGIRAYGNGGYFNRPPNSNYGHQPLLLEPLVQDNQWAEPWRPMCSMYYYIMTTDVQLHTPAGDFECVHVKAHDPTYPKHDKEYWFSRGIGIVKSKDYSQECTLKSYRKLP